MTDPPRGDSVFAGLEVLDENPDADAMDRMLLNLAASTDPPDWQLDTLQTDLYPTHYPPLPLQYIETDPDPNPDPDPTPPSPPRPPKRAHTAVCPLCGKAISNNGANFRRHEAACRRARLDKSSSDPSPHPTPQTPNSNHTNSQTSLDPSPPPPSPPLSSPSNWSRRDSDLLNVVRRLEQNINTLDVSARVCLRDALLSLSNKASNPTVTPTPQQEAMNRAAEYLVLRMLFLSGQQVMHTPPGTTPPSFTEQQQPPVASPPDHHHPHHLHTEDDGTVAASTGTGGPTLAKDEIVRPSIKPEDKIPDHT